jgi:hypothetical protein
LQPHPPWRSINVQAKSEAMSNHWFSHKSSDDGKGVDRRRVLLSGGSLLASSALMGEALHTAASRAAYAQASAATPIALPSDQIGEVAANAYLYAYPLILMELTRRIATNVAELASSARRR